MEEDIKILEEYLNYEVTKRKLSGCEILSIENLIARNKELEKMNEKYKIQLTDEQYLKIIDSVETDVNKEWNSKVRERIKQLEKEQEQNRKELAKGIDYLSNEMIESASKKIGINLSIREYLQELLQEGDK